MSSGTRSRASASGAGASGSAGGGGSPSPRKYTRRAAKDDNTLLMAPGLPYSGNKRKMSRTVIIEHTGGAPAMFRTKAQLIRDGLVAALAQIEVQINGHDERAGCFVVREEDGARFVELLNMVHPFNRLRNLPVDDVVTGIVNALLNIRAYRYND